MTDTNELLKAARYFRSIANAAYNAGRCNGLGLAFGKADESGVSEEEYTATYQSTEIRTEIAINCIADELDALRAENQRLRELVESAWHEQPYSGGWWEWREGFRGEPERLFITPSGSEVAEDDALAQELDREIEEDENYWECTATTQKNMPGLWRKAKGTTDAPKT